MQQIQNPEKEKEYQEPIENNGPGYQFLSTRSERVVFLLLLTLIAAGPLILRGSFPAHADWHSHMANVYQFKKAFWDGQLLPRWLDVFMYGYGTPKFNFYAPLLCYLFIVIDFFFRDPIIAMKLTVIATMLLTTLFGYIYLRKHTSPIASSLATIFIIFSPAIHMYTYNNNFPTNALAIPFVFLVLYGIDSFDKTQKLDLKAMLITASGYALVVLSHLPTAFMLTLLMVPYFFLTLNIFKVRQFIKFFISSFVLGAGLAAFYLFPAVLERKFVHIEVLSKGAGWDVTKNFLFTYLDRLPKDGYYWGVFDHRFYEVSNALFCLVGLICLVVLLTQIQRIKAYFSDHLRVYNAMIMFTISALLMTPVSYLFWTTFKEMQTLQFPWRFTSFVLPFGVLVFAFTFDLISKIAKEKVEAGGYKIINLAIVALLMLLVYVDFVNVYRWYWVNDQNLLKAAINVTWQNREYQPNLSNNPDWEKNDLVQDFLPTLSSTNSNADFELMKWKASDRIFEVFSPNNHIVNLRTFYFPGWTVYVDNKKTEVAAEPETGGILFKVPGGRHEIRAVFESTFVRKVSNYSSLIAIALFLYFLSEYLRIRKPKLINESTNNVDLEQGEVT